MNTQRPSILYNWRHDLIYWAELAVACVVFLVMNILTPYKEDDMGFTLIDGVWKPINTLGDFLQSCRNHYMTTNGRLSDLMPALFAAFLGKGAFNVFNTLVFGLHAHLVSLLSVRRRSVMVLSLFLAVVGTCYPLPGETMLWMSGSAGYLWAITASLLLIYVLQQHQDSRLGFGKWFLLLVGAMVAGGSNEATSFGFFAGLCLYYAFNHHRFDRWAAVAMTGYLAGMLIIIASPAAWSRAAADGGIILNLPLSELLSTRWNIFHEKVWQFTLPVAALAAGIIAVVLKRGKAVRKNVWTYIFLCLALVMFALGLRHERAYAPWATVSFIILAMGIDALIDQYLPRWLGNGARRQGSLSYWLRAALIAVTLALTVFTYGRGLKALHDYRTYDRQAVSEIVASPSQAVLLERQFDRYNRFIKPMNYQFSNFFGHEAIYRAYYGKKNIQFVADSVFVRFHEGRLLDGAEPLPISSDHPGIIDAAYIIPGQNYIAVPLMTDTLPAVYQTARYLSSTGNQIALSPEEQQRRDHYGINLNYTPTGFFPIEYQGKNYFICTRPDTLTSQMIFPVGIADDNQEVTLTILP